MLAGSRGPQLGWLADPHYGHLWTLDGSPRAFDARVFAADSDHPNGWGTLLVVGMRLGGGPVTIPDVGSSGANRAAVSAFAAGLGNRTSLVTRSAYVILDISNPELPPKLIAEFTDAEGRLVLADVMWYAQERFKPSGMVDLATLTGAIIASLANEYAGIFTNDDGLADRLVAAGNGSGDKLGVLPLAHHAHHRLRARRAHKQAPLRAQLLCANAGDILDGGDAGHGPMRELHVLQHLRQRGKHPAHFACRGAALRNRRHHLQSRDQPVARCREIGQDDEIGRAHV